MKDDQRHPKHKLAVRLTLVSLVLLVGAGTGKLFARMKKPPPKAERGAHVLAVETTVVAPEAVRLRLEGYGVARSLREVAISPEVAGTVLEVRADSEVGALVPEGGILFRLDPRDFEVAVEEARAMEAQARAALKRLELQEATDRERLVLLERSASLADREFRRAKTLYERDGVGSVAAVEAAEVARNQAETQKVILEQALSLYPAQREEVRANLSAASARLSRAQLNLDRCVVRAPFAGRVLRRDIERGEVVGPGREVMVLADDSVLEIVVALDAQDVRGALAFEEGGAQAGWFDRAKRVPVVCTWSDGVEKLSWSGTLDRIVDLDATTRTAQVAVRVSAEQARAGSDPEFPLVAGMFCQVDIPGREMAGVFALPRAAVTFDGRVYLRVDGVLKTRQVRVARSQGEQVLVDQGLSAGDEVIVTRLVAPLEGLALKVEPGTGAEED